jgi:hypothetical protein
MEEMAVGSADAARFHSHKQLSRIWHRLCDFAQPQFSRCFQTYCLHAVPPPAISYRQRAQKPLKRQVSVIWAPERDDQYPP